MAILLNAQLLEKTFAARTLFKEISFTIEDRDRIGLVGPNGTGKSTLLKIIASLETPDKGQLAIQRGLRVGYLAQEPKLQAEATVFETILEIAEKIDEHGGMAKAYEFVAKLGLSDRSDDKVVSLSGGWKKRVALACELVKEPQLLLLDEPTNHLDLESILWLEEYLASAPMAVVTITHDRLFLERVANRILDLDRRYPKGLIEVRGHYSQYLEAKEQLWASMQKQEQTLKNTLRREKEWLSRGAKARQTKQKARIERADDLKNQVSDISEKNLVRRAQFDFAAEGRAPQKLLEAKQISKSYGEKDLFRDFNLILGPKSRIGLLGNNGAGKSTLIRTLLKREAPTSGEVVHAENLQVAYFDQHKAELNPQKTLMQTISPGGDYVNFRGQYVFARSYLSRFLFRSEQLDMPIAKLSGGEQSRLRIAQLMLEPANLLVLDEPTNDLDVETLDVLQDCLVDFPGAVILVTHDRYFLDQVAEKIIAFTGFEHSDTGLMEFAGYLQWEAWFDAAQSPKPKKNETKVSALTATESGFNSSDRTSEIIKEKKKLSFKEQREFDGMESMIADLEKKLTDLHLELSKPEVLGHPSRVSEVAKSAEETQKKIDQLYARWEELEKKGSN